MINMQGISHLLSNGLKLWGGHRRRRIKHIREYKGKGTEDAKTQIYLKLDVRRIHKIPPDHVL